MFAPRIVRCREKRCSLSCTRVQHRFDGIRDAVQNQGGMRDTRNVEGGIREENILAGSGCAHFNWWDTGYT